MEVIYHMNIKLLPKALTYQGPFGGDLTKMRPWAFVYVHQVLANYSCVIVLNLFNLPGAHIVQKQNRIPFHRRENKGQED